MRRVVRTVGCRNVRARCIRCGNRISARNVDVRSLSSRPFRGCLHRRYEVVLSRPTRFCDLRGKDFQQLVILRRMVRDLNIPVRIIGHPTIREPDGLALSSRNAYLNEQERQQAPFIQKTLREAEQELRRRPVSRRALQNWMRRRIERGSLAKVDYVVAVDPETLKPKEPTTLPVLLAAAVFFGATRLIDNLLVE